MSYGSDPRLDRAQSLLDGSGLAGRVSVEGREGEIAAVRGAPELLPGLRALAPEIRALGFRYVALEPADDGH